MVRLSVGRCLPESEFCSGGKIKQLFHNKGIFQRRKTMKVFITKQRHGKYNYLLNWNNPETGVIMGDWFTTLKELKEYISGWNAILVRVNF